MENSIVQLENVVLEDMTFADAERMVQEQPFIRFDFQGWDEMIDESDASWFTQDHHPLMGMLPFGRMRLNQMLYNANKKSQGAFDMAKEQIDMWAVGAVAGALVSQKNFDMEIDYPVPGTNKKERILFNGWKLAHFEKIYKFAPTEYPAGCPTGYQRKTNWDFALGEDGKIYHITSGYVLYDNPARSISDDDKFFYAVRKAIFFDMGVVSNKNQAYFIAVSHGIFLTIDNLLSYPKVASGDFVQSIRKGDEEYISNFPIDPNGQMDVSTLKNINEKLSSFLPEDMKEDPKEIFEKCQFERQQKIKQQNEEIARREKEEKDKREKEAKENREKQQKELAERREKEERQIEETQTQTETQSVSIGQTSLSSPTYIFNAESDTRNSSNSDYRSGGCYVATAVYGSYDCPQVWTLRRYRDFYLLKSWYGRAFIKIYYAISPTLVKCFGEAGWFKQFWKNRLDKWVNFLKNKGYSDRPYHD